MCIFLLLVQVFWLLCIFYLVGWEAEVYIALYCIYQCYLIEVNLFVPSLIY